MKRTFRTEFAITYAGFVEGRHCYRIDFSDCRAEEAYGFRRRVADFLLIDLASDATMDNRAPFANPGHRDFFVYLPKLSDIEAFEERFVVTGYTPRLVA